MRHLKNFKNWLVVVYYACWKMSEQFRRDQLKHKQVENEQRQTSEVKLDDASAAVAMTSAEAAEVAKVSAPVQPQSALKKSAEIEKPSAKTVSEAAVKDRTPKAPAVEVKKTAKPEHKKQVRESAVEPQPSAPQVAPALAAKSQKVEAAPAVAVKAKPQGTNGGGAKPQASNGKYQPGAINDQTAQRLARLLVSEIKLYHKSKNEGEGAGELSNIYDLLKDPIEKSRQHYKQRMGAQAIESMPDYFHGELVRTLCGGDASRLGSNYPMDQP
jgi:hypothetical protein